jgi:putative flippase GtrA
VLNLKNDRVTKFTIVALINTAINLAVLNVLIFASGIGHSGFVYGVFETIGFLLASLDSYILNRQWTFEDKATPSSVKEFGRFLAISGIGLVINLFVSITLVHYLHSYAFNLSTERLIPSIGALCGVFISQFWNYHGYRNIFRKKF